MAATVKHGDQELVKVPRRGRKAAERKQRFSSMDEIAAQYFTPQDVIPPDGQPESRHKPTISAIELTEDGGGADEDDLPRAPVQQSEEAPPDTHDGVLRTLEDLMARFPFNGDGQYYIYVKRVAPRSFHGAATYGVQRYIKDRCTINDFIDTYGGGEYELIPYGPPRRGGQTDDNGQVVAKALAKPIKMWIPWVGDFATPPNPDSILTSENEEEDMEPSARRLDFAGRRIHTPATAKMHETELTFEEKRELRQREDERRREDRERRDRDAATGAVQSVAERTITMLEGQITSLQEELRGLREKPNGITTDGIASLLGAMHPKGDPDEIARMREQHQAEIARLERGHQQVLESIKSRHDDEMGRLRAAEREELGRMSRKVEDAERDCARKVTDAETRARAEVERAQNDARKDLERAEREYNRTLEQLRRDHEREIANMRTQFDQQLQIERGSYERERTMLKELSSSNLQTEKTVMSGEIAALKSELERVKLDLTAAKAELEKKGSLVKQMSEFNALAEQMGYDRAEGKGGEGEGEALDWKAMIAKGGVELASRFPEILSAVGQAFQARAQASVQVQQRQHQAQHAPPVHRQLQQVMPPAGAIGGWQTEDTMQPASIPDDLHPRSAVPTMPPPGQQQAYQQSYDQQQIVQAQPPLQAPPQQQMQPATPSALPPVNERRQRRRAQAQQPAPQAPPAQQQAPTEMEIPDDDMRQMQPQLEAALASGNTPIEVAQHIHQQFGVIGITMGAQISAESVARALQRIGQSTSPLARRDGQKFLRALQAEMIKMRDSQGVSS